MKVEKFGCFLWFLLGIGGGGALLIGSLFVGDKKGIEAGLALVVIISLLVLALYGSFGKSKTPAERSDYVELPSSVHINLKPDTTGVDAEEERKRRSAAYWHKRYLENK